MLWMTNYINEIRKQLRDVYNFKPNGGNDNEPLFDNIPNGEYPMTIDGKLDNVIVKDNKINCCNYAR